MGYRSQVAFSISGTKTQIPEVKEYIETGIACLFNKSNVVDSDFHDSLEFLKQNLQFANEGDEYFIRFLNHNIKWYHDSDWIWDKISDFAEFKGCNGSFRRIGEEQPDIDEKFFGDEPDSDETDYIFCIAPAWDNSVLFVDENSVMSFCPDKISLSQDERKSMVAIARNAASVAIADAVREYKEV